MLHTSRSYDYEFPNNYFLKNIAQILAYFESHGMTIDELDNIFTKIVRQNHNKCYSFSCFCRYNERFEQKFFIERQRNFDKYVNM